MPIAVIGFTFDPLLRLGDALVVRWQTIALAVLIAAILSVVGVMARRAGQRRDDLLLIVIGVVPGAVLFGRLGFALVHLGYYQAHPVDLFDPSIGGLELGTGVLGGLLTGAYVARLLGTTVGAWLHLAAIPVLTLLGVGKLTMVLGGAGQGAPSTLPWATAFLGDGPWASLAPGLPSHPAQVYEGVATVILALVLVGLLSGGAFRGRDGRVMFFGLALWALLRAGIALTWRDPAVLGPLDAGSILALLVAAVCLGCLNVMRLRRRRGPTMDGPGGVSWPDPGDRPPF